MVYAQAIFLPLIDDMICKNTTSKNTETANQRRFVAVFNAKMIGLENRRKENDFFSKNGG